MKTTALLLFFFSITTIAFTQNNKNMETYTDTRDGKVYKTVKIGNQVWMAENLAYKAESGCWPYDDDSNHVSKYGFLYNFETANKVCPTGWRLPTKSDFELLLKNTGSSPDKNYKALIENGSSGFSAISSGWRSLGGDYSYIDKYTAFFSATSEGEKNAITLYFDGMNAYLFGLTKKMGYSIRCIKE